MAKSPASPKNLRDLINQMLDDGATYFAIIQKLQQAHNTSLNPENLSNSSGDGQLVKN